MNLDRSYFNQVALELSNITHQRVRLTEFKEYECARDIRFEGFDILIEIQHRWKHVGSSSKPYTIVQVLNKEDRGEVFRSKHPVWNDPAEYARDLWNFSQSLAVAHVASAVQSRTKKCWIDSRGKIYLLDDYGVKTHNQALPHILGEGVEAEDVMRDGWIRMGLFFGITILECSKWTDKKYELCKSFLKDNQDWIGNLVRVDEPQGMRVRSEDLNPREFFSRDLDSVFSKVARSASMKLKITLKASKLEWLSSKSNMKGKTVLTFNRTPTDEEFRGWCEENNAQRYLNHYQIKNENVEIKMPVKKGSEVSEEPKVVYYLYYKGEPIYSILLEEGLNHEDVKRLAIERHKRVPLSMPDHAPGDFEMVLERSRVEEFPFVKHATLEIPDYLIQEDGVLYLNSSDLDVFQEWLNSTPEAPRRLIFRNLEVVIRETGEVIFPPFTNPPKMPSPEFFLKKKEEKEALRQEKDEQKTLSKRMDHWKSEIAKRLHKVVLTDRDAYNADLDSIMDDLDIPLNRREFFKTYFQ